MRETLTRLAAAAITCLLVLLAGIFADRRNDPGEDLQADPEAGRPSTTAASPAPDPMLAARGAGLYEELGCARCHAIAGAGNPRAALDGVGARRPAEELRDWVVGGGAAQARLSRTARRAKERYAELPDEALDALVAHLSSLR